MSEVEKLRNIGDDSQRIGEFLEWLQGERKLVIAEWLKRGQSEYWDEQLVPAGTTINGLLAEFYDIDLAKLDEEKLAMLDKIRQAHAEASR